MSTNRGQQAQLRRALNRRQTRAAADPELRHGASQRAEVRGMPAEVRSHIAGARTEALLQLLRDEDAKVRANQPMVAYVVEVLAARLGSLDILREEGLEWALGAEREHVDDTHTFVGWIEMEGRIKWVDHAFHPEMPQDIASERLDRYQRLDGCGGILARADDRAAADRVEKLRHNISQWRGTGLEALGAVDADKIARALGPVTSHGLRQFLEAEGNDSVMLALDGRRVVALDASGNAYRFNKIETKHLALVGLLPRHYLWYLPLHWWKQKKMEQEEEEQDKRGKTRIYKGRYDDEDELEHDEKDDYGG